MSGGPTVLAIDDSTIVLAVLAAQLEALGCAVTCVTRAAEGLERLEGGDVDLVLVDLTMPVMDGYAFAEEVRRREREDARRVPIVAVTGVDDPTAVARAHEAGIDDFLLKPVRLGALREALARCG